jgi:hexosaminidase
MKKSFLVIFLFLSVTCFSQLNIVPLPAQIKMGNGIFNLNNKTSIVLEGSGLEKNAAFINDYLQQFFGYKLKITKIHSGANSIFLNYEHIVHDIPGAYNFTIDNKGLYIAGGNETGVFYGIQTLFQLLPPGNKTTIPHVTILDYPRFPYRGMHLDVGRHFFPVSFIKKYIDYLAAYKYNIFHWHLTEDQGWRIEIKKYPNLTKTGAWRNGTIIGRYPGKGSDNKTYGGFYTQAQIKEVVAYAAARHIDVIPEIEMPGHSSAAIASYPWLSCFPAKPTAIPANMISQKSIDEQKAGRIKLVQETWGVFDDVFCAGKDSTFKFLENVIDEVLPLFPSKYFHLGGDESPKTHWKICPACQKRIKDLNLKDEHELQSWFVQRIEKYVNSKGKTMIGWDEILEGGLAPNAVVMSWRGEKGGIEAAKQKHKVIMTPGNPVYFDHTQSKNEDSVTIGGYNPIENVYAYEPIPKELVAAEEKYVLGAQANMWTEYMEYTSKIEYMMFPRMTALSEVLWSPKEKRDWKDFERRLPAIYERLDKQKINYSKAYYEPKVNLSATADFDGIEIKVKSKQEKSKYYFGNKTESEFTMYLDSIDRNIKKSGLYGVRMLGKLSPDSKGEKWGIAYLTPYEFLFSTDIKLSFNKATGKKITIVTAPSKSYPGDGAFTLVNGVQNEKGMSKSSEFLGFSGTDLDVTIDLGKEMDVSTVTVHVLKQTGSWIYLPSQVDVTYIPYIDTTIITKHPPLETITVIVNADDDLDRIEIKKEKFCRYIQVRAKNYGIIPTGKPGAGNPAWLFVDEIEVK